jgi:flavin-dependent dehydrogenase
MEAVKNIVIVGGGTAGWLTAATLAAEYRPGPAGLNITLVESDQTAPIGVGEGTWPSMRTTLGKIGIPEAEFLRECDASFKQGSKFVGWMDGGDEFYYHPFTLPESYQAVNLVDFWPSCHADLAFAQAVTPQFDVCEASLAPKQIAAPDYAGTLNYGYHLDAVKFATLLRTHAVEKLGVNHVVDHVTGIIGSPDEDVRAIVGERSGEIEGDLFVDCSGFSSLLLGQHYGVEFLDMGHVLFNDRALAVQVPYADESAPIASVTLGTAQSAGWVWDIGLPTRKGTGYVYSSRHLDEAAAREELLRYLRKQNPEIAVDELPIRLIEIRPGYRQKFWHRNCVAIGLSSGFIEPLEASALVLVELTARMLADELPTGREHMDLVAGKFNDKFSYRWRQVIEFLKLHYVLSRREDSSYWLDNRSPDSIPTELAERLALWQSQTPWFRDETHVDEMFPSASYQYVMYGMQYAVASHWQRRRAGGEEHQRATAAFSAARDKARKYLAHLPSNRQLIRQVHAQRFATI